MTNNIKIVVSFLTAFFEVFLAQKGKMLWIVKALELQSKTDILSYSKDMMEWIGLGGVFFFINYLLIEIVIGLYGYIKERRERLSTDFFTKIAMALYPLILLLPKSPKYGLRGIGYIIIPLTLYKIIKERKKLTWDITDIFCGFFSLGILVSIVNAVEKKQVFRNFQDYILILLLPLIMKQYRFGERFQWLLIRTGMLTFAVKIMLGYYEKLGMMVGEHTPRIGGGMAVWTYAGLIMLGIVYLMNHIVNGKSSRKERVLYLFPLVLSAVPMLWSQNRANWVAILAVISLMSLKKHLVKGIVVVAVLGGLLFGAINSPKINNKYVNRVKTIVNYKNDVSSMSRLELWRESVHMLKTSPITGVGFSTGNFIANERYKEYKVIPNTQPHHHSHSSYLYILATTGIVGIIGFLAFNLGYIYIFFKEKSYLGNLGLYTIFSFQMMGFFETPIRDMEIIGILMIIIGYISAKIKEKAV